MNINERVSCTLHCMTLMRIRWGIDSIGVKLCLRGWVVGIHGGWGDGVNSCNLRGIALTSSRVRRQLRWRARQIDPSHMHSRRCLNGT